MNKVTLNQIETSTTFGYIATSQDQRGRTNSLGYRFSPRTGAIYQCSFEGLGVIETKDPVQAMMLYNNRPKVEVGRLAVGDKVVAFLDVTSQVNGFVAAIYTVGDVEVVDIKGELTIGGTRKVNEPYAERIFNSDYPCCFFFSDRVVPFFKKLPDYEESTPTGQ